MAHPVKADRTQVAIVGAGPAGLFLGHLLHRAGIDTVILEARSREHVEGRIRAGVLEQGTADALRDAGLGERLDREGLVHDGIHVRFDETSHRIDFKALTGRTVTIYGQTEVVKDLVAARIDSGAPLAFEVDDVRVDAEAPLVRYRHDGAEHELRCDAIAGCDGFHGVCRDAMPDLSTWERAYPFAWLGILADVAPSTDELIYARHERGFALHSMRSPTRSRLYIQVDPGDELDAWPDERVWEELHARFATPGWSLTEGPVLDKSITPMRSFVAAPLRHGALYLAGDAAHIVPPTGAKGLNLAMADVRVLAEALIDGSPAALEGYSDRCLAHVWRAQHFSWWMTQMLHVDPADDAYGAQLARAQLEYVTGSEAAARSLAENYVGYHR
jgi:p-hydroxybenzoate 3-monooxygenase